MRPLSSAGLPLLFAALPVAADVGDPQSRTDHPWYPGELACSTFERLFETQEALYARVVGVPPKTDEQKALAAWLWRNTHYWHGEEGKEDLWGEGFEKGRDLRTRDYWTGLFAHGFGLCGTTHSQWTAEIDARLGPGRARGVGVEGHNSFEAFLTGGPYGAGKWVLIDHDISTVVYDDAGAALLSIPEVMADWKRLTDRSYKPDRQHGWLVCGLHPKDGGVYAQFLCAEYFAGYAGPPPVVHLRRGETFRRYLQPGLEDGKTYVFWGRNYKTAGIPGPERSRTWVNQPDAMYGSKDGAPYRDGQARFANAVYVYAPDFASGDYREGAVEETDERVTFEFQSPYIIAATPPDDSPWGIYKPGGRNGLVLRGRAACPVSVSVDRGTTWRDAGPFSDGMDLTDLVKGFRQYWIRFGAGAKALAGTSLTMTTVCQANGSVIPQLKDRGTRVDFNASGRAVVSAGPTRPQARAHVVEGAFDTPSVTLELATPRREPILAVCAVAHVASGNPPRPDVAYQIEYSADGGATWRPVVKDWTIPRRGVEPKDFWSQSLCSGSVEVAGKDVTTVRVRFRNSGGKPVLRAEAHLVYRVRGRDATKVTFDWTDDAGPHRASRVFPAGAAASAFWSIPTGTGVRTRWVEYEAVKGD